MLGLARDGPNAYAVMSRIVAGDVAVAEEVQFFVAAEVFDFFVVAHRDALCGYVQLTVVAEYEGDS